MRRRLAQELAGAVALLLSGHAAGRTVRPLCDRTESVVTETPHDEKPVVVQLWLDGAISTSEAIQMAMFGDDPSAKVWAIHLFSMGLNKPEDIVRISGV
jgi:hypothetical protein